MLLTGFHLTYRHIPNLQEAIGNTAYGLAYLMKHLVLAALVVLAAVNFFWLGPRSARVRLGLWRLEVLLAGAIVFFTAWLTLTPPATQTPSLTQPRLTPVLMAQQVEDWIIALLISSDRVGANVFDVLVTDSAGRPGKDIQRVWLTFTYLDGDLGEASAIAQPQGNGRFRAQGSFSCRRSHQPSPMSRSRRL